ncbi:MAG: hypothetical protein NTW10_05685 [Bacteroidetes bacterium]|nr:hypothetical protein [Bacteroidota bacterium]
MILKKAIPFLLLSIVLVCSCKKNAPDNSALINSSASLIKEMSYYDSIGNFITSQSMEYNSQRQIVLMKSYYPKQYDTVITRYEYHSNQVIESHFDTNDMLNYKYIYELNGIGLAVSRTIIDYKSSADSTLNLDATYKYNSEGFLIESKFSPDDSLHWFKMNYQISGSNISSQQYSDKYGSGPLRIFVYYPNSINTLGNYNEGISWFGKSSKELAKSSAYNTSAPDSMYYFYSFDSQNRPAIEKFREQHPSVGSRDLRITYY